MSEKELEDVMYYQRFQDIYESGVRSFPHDRLIRQLPIGCFGRPDLVGINFLRDDKNVITNIDVFIYELKVNHVSFAELCQALKYKYAIQELFLSDKKNSKVDFSFYVVLIGRTIDSCADFMGAAAESEIALYTYNQTPKGVLFTRVKTYQYRPETFEYSGFGQWRRLNLFHLDSGKQEVIYNPAKDESWVKYN